MNTSELRRRRGGAVWIVVADTIRTAWWGRSWLVAALLVISVIATVLAIAGQTALPIVIYPAL